MKPILLFSATSLALVALAPAVLIVNPPIAIDHVVQVQPIIVQQAPAQGGATATYFGTAGQAAIIEAHVDTIWSQVGVDIEFLPSTTYVDSFAFNGFPTDYSTAPRPLGDLNAINTAAGSPPKNSNPAVLNMFFVDIVPGFSFTSENTANGLAFVGGNGVTQFVGDNLLTFEAGREVIASVVAHEIGHNLGLPHLVEAENLMQEGGSPNPGERLTAADRATILAVSGSAGTGLLQAIPEPSGVMFSLLGLAAFAMRRQR